MAFGILNPEKETAGDGKDAFLFRMEIPKFLSLLAERDSKAFVPGINDLLKGGYPLKDGTTALSAQEKIEKGKTAIGAFSAYRAAKAAGNDADAQVAAKVLKENVPSASPSGSFPFPGRRQRSERPPPPSRRRPHIPWSSP